MPKKTKKEKVIAEARRLIAKSQQFQSVAPSSLHLQQTQTVKQQVPTTFQFQPKSNIQPQAQNDNVDENEFHAIRKDIIKTVVLAGAAIAFECIVYLRLGK
jgi:hypothetical protein